ncbi:MAG: hypothetical protein NWS48_13985 [Akkermansiaceae bacterium]|nr:hypothetical protein [Akkermansiaceae bacterium]
MNPEDATNPSSPEQKKRGWLEIVSYGFIYGCIAIGILVCVLMYFGSSPPRAAWKADANTAVSNARSVGLALFSFQNEYGAFPSDETRADVEEEFGTSIDLSGPSSNALLRQLFAAEIIDSEEIFFAKIKGHKKPDGLITPGNILEPGECNFAYISGLSTSGASSTPLLITPIIPGTKKFDRKPFGGCAVVLRIDQSVQLLSIHKDGYAYDKSGIDILSPDHPAWNGTAPDIRYPE